MLIIITKEEKKLDEAKFFYNKMVNSSDFPTEFEYNLSAFLTASRSVLQYLLEDIKNKPGGQFWHDNLVAQNIYIKYFRDKRDINIHQETIQPKKGIGIELSENINISESLSIELRDKEGNVKESYNSKSNQSENKKQKNPIVKIIYFFDDWAGNEDILKLCGNYIAELEKFIVEAKNGGYLV
jgi:hypothetical protein